MNGSTMTLKNAKRLAKRRLPQDVELLEELVLTGVRKAIEEGRAVAQSEMGKVTGGVGLPPGLGF